MHEEEKEKEKQVPVVSQAAVMGIKLPGGAHTSSPLPAEEKPQVAAGKVIVGSGIATSEIDGLVRQNTIESDRDYRKITQDIIEITKGQLEEHNKDKKPLRRDLLDFVKGLLGAQFGMLVFFILTNNVFELKISDDVLEVYIVSVFVETLAGLIIMIKYAFNSTQEVKLIEILNEIISHFKKYEEK